MKKAQVIWTDQSLHDLEIIYDFLVAKSPSAAQQLVERILDKTRQLEFFPESGAQQEIDSSNSRKYRYLVEGNYKLIYRYEAETKIVFVATVFDTRFDPETLRLG